jgi:DNA polymerase III subunit gamma/tau
MWDLKYRPKRFADVLGQEAIVRILKGRLAEGSADTISYIFSGGMGLGKTTLSRILGKALLCESLGADFEPCCICSNCLAVDAGSSPAFAERDAASSGTVEHMRALVEELPFAVLGAGKRISLFDEAHRMSRDAQDILLKPIEEKKLVAIFCTTEPEKIRGTIRSRCEHYQIQKVKQEVLLDHLKQVLTNEGVPFEEDAVRIVLEFSAGHVRDILNRLEMVSYLGPVTVASVREHLRLSDVASLYEALLYLDNPDELIRRVDLLHGEFSPQELAERLADAAMNVFRLGSGLPVTQYNYDYGMASRVWAKYGASLLQVVSGLLKDRKNSIAGLLVELLRFSSPVERVPVPTVNQPAQPVKSQPVAYALTALDHEAIPKSLPRGVEKGQKKSQVMRIGTSSDILTPPEWAAQFTKYLGVAG